MPIARPAESHGLAAPRVVHALATLDLPPLLASMPLLARSRLGCRPNWHAVQSLRIHRPPRLRLFSPVHTRRLKTLSAEVAEQRGERDSPDTDVNEVACARDCRPRLPVEVRALHRPPAQCDTDRFRCTESATPILARAVSELTDEIGPRRW